MPAQNREAELRKTPTQTRSRTTVSIILAAARQIVVRRGDCDFTAASVAQRAGVSPGTLYQSFPNVEAIIDAVAAVERSRLADAVETVDIRSGRTLEECLQRLLSVYRNEHENSGRLTRALGRRLSGHRHDIAAKLHTLPHAVRRHVAHDDVPAAFDFAGLLIVALIWEMGDRARDDRDDDVRYSVETVRVVHAYLTTPFHTGQMRAAVEEQNQ